MAIATMSSKENIHFDDIKSYRENKTNPNLWYPYIETIAKKKNLDIKGQKNQAGFNATYPTFILGEYVFKFFGFRPKWREVYSFECKAQKILQQDQNIFAPNILACGDLFEDSEKSDWSYIVFTKVEGKSLHHSELSHQEKLGLAAALGSQLAKVHKLKCNWKFNKVFWENLDLVEAAKKSVLPVHLTEQIEDFIKTLDPFDLVFVNSDIVENHIFHNHGKLTGIIDWGDAAYTDRHYELGKLHLSSFDMDKNLLKEFIKASNWPVSKNFAKQALGMALYRQAMGLRQHNSFDVFHKLPHLFSLNKIKTLEELSEELFSL